jgi:hypothetical protein
MRWLGRRHEQDVPQLQPIGGQRGEPEMADVRRIEGAAQDPDPPATFLPGGPGRRLWRWTVLR